MATKTRVNYGKAMCWRRLYDRDGTKCVETMKVKKYVDFLSRYYLFVVCLCCSFYALHIWYGESNVCLLKKQAYKIGLVVCLLFNVYDL